MSRVMSTLLCLEHVQLDMPPGAEAAARAFYAGVLGMSEISKPRTLSPTGAWFAAGTGELHLSAVPDARPPLEGSGHLGARGDSELPCGLGSRRHGSGPVESCIDLALRLMPSS